MTAPAGGESHARIAAAIAVVAASMTLLALLSHQGMPWLLGAAAGLVAAAAGIFWSGFGAERPAAVLGLDGFSGRTALWSLAGLALGAGAALLHRDAMNLPMFPPAELRAFIVVACLIGATEELVFRGWLMGRARAFGWIAAILIAALAHAAYKTALFAWPPEPAPFNLMRMAIGTFAGGIVIGALRAASGSLAPALAMHMAFDFIVYRTYADMPWWVWG